MSERDFLGDEAKKRCKAAVQSVESVTAAEIVVAVRPRSGVYREADYLVGALSGFVVLLCLLFLPTPFVVEWMPFEVLGAFVLGSIVCSRSPRLRRLVTSSAHRSASVETAARAAFVELGVSRTRGRTGVLVFLSLLERQLEVVADVGVEVRQLAASWDSAVAELRAAVREGADLDRFVRALEALGPLLGEVLPHSDDDVNELPDEVST
jgi:putative membrane protein